jgi:hypothetical protein
MAAMCIERDKKAMDSLTWGLRSQGQGGLFQRNLSSGGDALKAH